MGSIYEKLKDQLVSIKDKGAFYIFFGNFTIKFIAFFGSVFIVGILSKDEYGTLGYVENLFSYAYLFAGLGMTNALLRYVVLADTLQEKKQYYSYIISRSFIFNIFLVAIACVVAILYPHPEGFKPATFLLPLLLLSLPFHSLVDSNTCLYRAMFNNKRFALATCITASSIIVTKYILARFFSLPGAVFASLAVYSVVAVVLCLAVRRRFFAGVEKAPPLIREQKNTVIKYSLQYMVTNGIWALFMLNDIFLLGRLTKDASVASVVANYKVAYVFPGNLSLISTSIGVLVAPFFVRRESDYPWVRKAYKKTYLATAGIVLCAVLVLYIFAEPLISLLYGEKYIDAVPVMRVLLIAAFINNGIRYTNAHLLSSMGQVKYNMYISLAGVLMQVAINIQVIPRFGAIGVAYTSVGVYSLMAIALLIVFYNKYFRNTPNKTLG
ncbi:MAG: oligosaccharide flippase family protein [Oscillospiraceae bacterium]|nr:oligosaccharide flippase family protein [Oscillospiraceae bacterium]MDD4546192.1 oligosaccharide flippase family protein [Oscillospiraceae bacterium]